LFNEDRDLIQLFPGPWTSVTFELGPQAVTTPQALCNHLQWCWLAMTALGSFDSKCGGHLILWDLGRILEFPAGCTVLLPPILRFSIARVRPGERRYSMTQYIAAPDVWERWPVATSVFPKLNQVSLLRT
ncbi:hypothetical protein B0H13DRAFT_1657480, partial [Mycena leptocephala]